MRAYRFLCIIAFLVCVLVYQASRLSGISSRPVHSVHDPVWEETSWYNIESPTCTRVNLRVRKDYEVLTDKERRDFSNAIKCLMDKPSQLNNRQYPAATNRYMDYAVVHVSRAHQVHLSGYFLTWHREFLWLFEEELRCECDYKGTLPYWNWPKTANDLDHTHLFDGSEISLSGNGEFNGTDDIILGPKLRIPHGSGGGCVVTGPFAYHETLMKPIPVSHLTEGTPLPKDTYYQHRQCLTRDLNIKVAQRWTNSTGMEEALSSESMQEFDRALNGVVGEGILGLHSGAHLSLGVPASNIYVSVQDPVWWPLHTMLDLVYSSWQSRFPEIALQLWGTETSNDVPISAEVRLDSYMPDWGVLGPEYGKLQVGDLMHIRGGPLCYRYDREL